MGIEIRQLRYAVMTADTQSFSRAAAALNVKQSTLSRRVMQLEERLGVKLFERTTRGAEPTENGRVFIEQARRIVTDIENLQTTARNVSYGLQGRIAVGYCSPLMSGNLKLTFSDYLTRFPDVQFDGVEAGPEKLLNGLLSRTIDVAVAPIGLTEAGLKTRLLWSERLFVVLVEGNRLIPQERIYWQDLRREIFVVPGNGLGPILGNLISARLTEQGFRPNIIYQDTSLESVLSMVSAKRYISVATESSQGVSWPELHFREIYDPSGPARLEFALYWCEDNDNPALKRFFKLIEERYPC
ncbi:LysR family transcriptional regulator [Rhizorhabdus dicambivorans]|uniref:LysR family transcriptional regulator n=1 Tax=Rhizorhabdus dicambivorans TaxID=1850238 RepID=A0A2A4FQZ0_9SPHN|nr:LysR family transcriptional regulator [Rhizorhabdus dicambivorans]ATE66832.1 LysR family transcriptional regulator [Rhizorhabdus dicambivorans]PCE40823.1 LysR family transcriptional regulator [Rhizorhabdus dicambivorans]